MARWRIDILRAGVVVRSLETTQLWAAYPAAMRAEDFGEGPGSDAPGAGRVRVAQWGEAFGWGVAAEIALP